MAIRILLKATYAFPNIPMATGMRESLVIEQYVSGLGNPDWKLKRHAQFAHPSTLDRAISIAVEFEAFEESQMYNTDDILEITDGVIGEAKNATHATKSDISVGIFHSGLPG